MSYRAYHDYDDDRVYALGVGSGGAGESYIPFCLSGVQGAVQDALGEAEFDGAVRGLLVDHEAWEGLDAMKGRGLRSS